MMEHATVKRGARDLRTSVQLCIQEMNQRPGESMKFSDASARFGIKMRRLYDIVNIFSAAGCCQKSGLEGLIWIGLDKIRAHVGTLAAARQIDNPRLSLIELFPVSGSVGIAKLTGDYLLLYRALRTSHLDLRMAATLFARGTGIFRSTLCKLYQITYALCSAGIATRTALTCDVALIKEYMAFQVVPVGKSARADPADLESMLNHREDPTLDYIHRRRQDFRQLWEKSANSRAGTLPPGQDFF
jgi:hypothetical protein